MNFKEKYNLIIEDVEDNIKLSEKEICNIITKHTGIGIRSLGDVFKFITNVTLSQYIKQRKLINTFKFSKESGCTFEDAAFEFSYPDSATFSHSFKNVFGTSPTQTSDKIFEKKQPLTFEIILNERIEENIMDNNEVLKNKNKRIFGISSNQYNIIKQILELGAIYGFTDEQSEFVYQLSKRMDLELSKAFDFAEDLFLQMENGTYYGDISVDKIASLYFNRKLSVSESIEVIEDLESQGVADIESLPDDFWKIYFGESNKLYDFYADDILSFIETMKEEKIPIDEFDDVMDCCWGGDILEKIHEYNNLFDELYELDEAYINNSETIYEK